MDWKIILKSKLCEVPVRDVGTYDIPTGYHRVAEYSCAVNVRISADKMRRNKAAMTPTHDEDFSFAMPRQPQIIDQV